MVDFIRPRMVRIQCNFFRSFVLALLLTICYVPAHAGEKLVAVILSSDSSRYKDAHRSFVKTVEKGYDPNNIEIIMQCPNPDPISWANSIRKAIAIGADIIVTYGAPVTLSAISETDDIPIVFIDVFGPVETGITRSMTATGRNLTGVSSKVPLITLIKTVLDVKPIKNLGVIYHSKEIGSVAQLKELKRIAAQLGFAVTEINVSSLGGLDLSLNSLLSRVDCIYVSESAVGCKGFEKIVRRANGNKVPVISLMPSAADKGALISLEISPSEQGELAGECALKVFSGKKISHIPIATPKRVDMIINLRAARILDLHIPPKVLNVATKVLK